MELETRFIIATFSNAAAPCDGRIRFDLRFETKNRSSSIFHSTETFFTLLNDLPASFLFATARLFRCNRNFKRRKERETKFNKEKVQIDLGMINRNDGVSGHQWIRWNEFTIVSFHVQEVSSPSPRVCTYTRMDNNKGKLDSLRVCVCVRRLNLIELSFSEILVYYDTCNERVILTARVRRKSSAIKFHASSLLFFFHAFD